MYHSVIVLQLTHWMVYEQCHRWRKQLKRNLYPGAPCNRATSSISSNLERSNLRKRTKLKKHPPFTTQISQMEETQNVTYRWTCTSWAETVESPVFSHYWTAMYSPFKENNRFHAKQHEPKFIVWQATIELHLNTESCSVCSSKYNCKLTHNPLTHSQLVCI